MLLPLGIVCGLIPIIGGIVFLRQREKFLADPSIRESIIFRNFVKLAGFYAILIGMGVISLTILFSR